MKRLLPLLVVAGAGALLALTTPYWPLLASLLPPCPFRTLTGIPCPTCGSTRALLALARGHLLEALASNPLLTAGAGAIPAALGFWAVLFALGKPLPRQVKALESRWPSWLRSAVLLALLANWLWVVSHR